MLEGGLIVSARIVAGVTAGYGLTALAANYVGALSWPGGRPILGAVASSWAGPSSRR